MPYWLKVTIILVGIGIVLFGLFFIDAIFSWKTPIFSSTNYEGVRKKAIETKDPSKCEKLATNLGDFNPRSNCYSESIFAIGDVSLCDQYPVNRLICRYKIAVKHSDISLCTFTDPNQYNFCIYQVAAGSRNSTICDSLKESTNYSKPRCILGIIEDNNQHIPAAFSVQDALRICNFIQDKYLKDVCIGNILIMSKDASLCTMFSNISSLNGYFAVDGTPVLDVCR